MSEHRFHIRIPVKVQNPEDRVEAIFRYWDFINDIKVEILNFKGTEQEFAKQIISAAIRYLYPTFNITEVTYQTFYTYKVLQIPLPNKFHHLFSSSYEDYYTKRFKL